MQEEREALAKQVQFAVSSMQESHNKAEQRFEEIQGEKERLEDEFASLAEEITNKDNIIKTLTKENLQINSRVT